MANEGIPLGGQYPSRSELNNNLRQYIANPSDLRIDRRKLYGKQAGRLFSDQLNEKDLDEGYLGSGKYLPSSYSDGDYNVFDNTNPANQQVIDNAGGAQGANFQENNIVEWEIPTSSTDYKRPRTVAAAYDEIRGVMTVVFRDGTFYNYYEVSPTEWQAFHASYSKGRPWLNTKNSKQAADGLFINKPRGIASDMNSVDEGGVDPQIREALYRVARTQQQKVKPKQGRTTQHVYKTGTGTNAHYGLEQSPRGRKRQAMPVPNRMKSDLKNTAKKGGTNPANANRNKKAS